MLKSGLIQLTWASNLDLGESTSYLSEKERNDWIREQNWNILKEKVTGHSGDFYQTYVPSYK